MTPLLGLLGVGPEFRWQLGVLAFGAALAMLLHQWHKLRAAPDVTSPRVMALGCFVAALFAGTISACWVPPFSARDDLHFFRHAESVLVPGHTPKDLSAACIGTLLGVLSMDDLTLDPLERLHGLRQGWRALCALGAALSAAMLFSLLARWRRVAPALAAIGLLAGSGLWVHAASRFPEALLALACGLAAVALVSAHEVSTPRAISFGALGVLGAILHPLAVAPIIGCAVVVLLEKKHQSFRTSVKTALTIGGTAAILATFYRPEFAVASRFAEPIEGIPLITVLPGVAVVLWEFTPLLLLGAATVLVLAFRDKERRSCALGIIGAFIWVALVGTSGVPHLHQQVGLLLPILAAMVLLQFPATSEGDGSLRRSVSIALLLAGVLSLPVPYLAGRREDGARSRAMLKSIQQLATDDAVIVAGAESDLAELLRLASPSRRWEIATLEGPRGAQLPVSALRLAQEQGRPVLLNTAWDSFILPPGESVESLAAAVGFRITTETPRVGTFLLLRP